MDSILKSRKRLAFSRSVVVALCLGFIGGMVLQSITGMPPLLGDGRFVLDAAGSRSIQPVRRCDCVQNATHEIQPPSGVPSTGTGVQKLDQSSPPPCWRNETVELVPPSEGSTNQIGSQNCLRDESEYEWRAVKKLPQQFIHTNSDYHRRNYTKLPPQVLVITRSISLIVMNLKASLFDHTVRFESSSIQWHAILVDTDAGQAFAEHESPCNGSWVQAQDPRRRHRS